MRSLQLKIWYTAPSGSKTCLLSDNSSCLGFQTVKENAERDLVVGGWSGLLFHNSKFTLWSLAKCTGIDLLGPWQFIHLLYFSPVRKAHCPHQVTYQVSESILLLLPPPPVLADYLYLLWGTGRLEVKMYLDRVRMCTDGRRILFTYSELHLWSMSSLPSLPSMIAAGSTWWRIWRYCRLFIFIWFHARHNGAAWFPYLFGCS